ncbi:MAG: SDR family oxidoreductase [Clostridiaceae bacterium]|nr:SDR family oxidoreductase [Clostridiaceae bacterium]
MKIAVLSGASSGIGLCIANFLLMSNYKLYTLSRSRPPIDSTPNMIHIPCDLTIPDDQDRAVSTILDAESHIDLLINCAGEGQFGPHETIDANNIRHMLRLNLEAPVVMTGQFLRAIRAAKGHIINISSISATGPAPHGCAYAAGKSGLSHFTNSLFEETRRQGIAVSLIQPDLTQTRFYDDIFFEPENIECAYIEPEQVAEAVKYVIESRSNMCVTEINLRPQFNRIHRKSSKTE